jgi:hypothetical protein
MRCERLLSTHSRCLADIPLSTHFGHFPLPPIDSFNGKAEHGGARRVEARVTPREPAGLPNDASGLCDRRPWLLVPCCVDERRIEDV